MATRLRSKSISCTQLLTPMLIGAALLVTVFNLVQPGFYTASSQKRIKKIIDPISTTQDTDTRVHHEYHLKPLDNDLFRSVPVQTLHTFRTYKPRISKLNDTQYKPYLAACKHIGCAWYQYLNEYGVELQWLSLKDGQRFISHPINEHFIIYPGFKTVEYFLCQAADGFGNGLSMYWGARSLAYWMNFNFKISCKNYWNNLQKNKLMSAFLPWSIARHDTIDTMNTNQSVISFYPRIDRTPAQHAVVHDTSLLFMYYNPYFQHIMHHETMNAMREYYHYTKRNHTLQEMDRMNQTSDIVIHIRCGDVLQIMHRVRDWDYGFLTMDYYKYVMQIGLQQAFGINWYHKMTENTTVWILSQLTRNAARKGELNALKDCEFLVNYMVDHGMRDLFAPATVQMMYDSDVNDDFYRMLIAPLLFCSPSTYCFNAGMANTNGIVVIPSRGAWVKFSHLSHKNRTSYEQNENDFIVVQNSSLIAKNQLIIDTEKAGWHCNQIDNYVSSKRTYNQHEYAHKLGEYLVSH